MRILAVTAFLLLPVAMAAAQTSAGNGTADATLYGPGISQRLAESRAARVRDLRYDLRVSIEALAEKPIAGLMSISFTLRDADASLALDFAAGADHVTSVTTSHDTSGRYEYSNGHIIVPASALRAGLNRVDIVFTAGDASLNRGKDFLYALFVPARAHLAIPCFDQPDLKARWTLTVGFPNGMPATWQAISNGAGTATTVVPADGRTPRAYPGVKFAETEPLSTYLFSFVVGDFKVETAARNGRTFRLFHRETDAAKVTRNRDTIFDLHARAIEFMERYTAIPYPFGKFDFVLIPAFQFGGMEHAGKILYNASGLMLDESATQNQLLGRASVIAHETAHMWFGDLVTMRWFNDVWMKEVFANFMAAKIVNPAFPEVNHDLRFLLAHYPAAYDVDRTAGANPIRQTLDNLNEAGSLYGAIIYQKAPIVMRHLEQLMGEEAFRDGLREYLKTFAFKNATWLDLIALLDTRTPVDLGAWSKVWVEEPGRPTITTELAVDGGRITRLAFRQTDPANSARQWPEQLRVAMGNGEGQLLTVPLDGPRAEVATAAGRPAPSYILPNGGGWAYGAFVIDPATLAYLSTSIFDITDPLTRGSAWVTLWDAMLDGRVPATTVVDLAMTALPRETDEQLRARVLGYTTRAWWRFLSPAERTARVATLESTLRTGLDAAPTPSQKSAWFSTLRDVAARPDTLAWLRRVWAREEPVSGLTLAETDYITLAEELAVREVNGWQEILQAQLGRIENPDRKQRFQFVLPALSADATARARWFASLADVANRRREPWVLDGLNYLHHPLRAAQSMTYVPQSLAMLKEIQQTGDIFFPKRWLDATLGGHSSPEAARMVQTFLDGLPADYPARLRAITLQSSDELFRAARLTKP